MVDTNTKIMIAVPCMDMVAAHCNVDCSMHFDACYLCTAKLHHVVDMVDMVVFDDAEH